MVFQAMAGRYRMVDIVRHVFATGSKRHHQQLEQELEARYSGKATLYHKGRAALAEAIRLATDGSGRVAISGLTCYSVVQAVEAAGCTPVYVDSNEDDLQFSAEAFAAACDTEEIKAVVIQNMLGIPAEIDGIMAVAKRYNVTTIEDLAHSVGAVYANGREVGTVGDITMLSFGKDKALDVVNGGALVVRNNRQVDQPSKRPGWGEQMRDRLYPLIAAVCRALYPIGLGKFAMGAAIRLKFVVRSADGRVDTSIGMPKWQTQLALRQLHELDSMVDIRRQKASIYTKALVGRVPKMALQTGASLIRVPLFVANRDEVVDALARKGIFVADVWYDVPVSPVRFYERIEYPETNCPVAVQVSSRLLNLPTHRRVSEDDMRIIIETVQEVAR